MLFSENDWGGTKPLLRNGVHIVLSLLFGWLVSPFLSPKIIQPEAAFILWPSALTLVWLFTLARVTQDELSDVYAFGAREECAYAAAYQEYRYEQTMRRLGRIVMYISAPAFMFVIM